MTDNKEAPYGHTPFMGQDSVQNHTGFECKACGWEEGYAAGRASRDNEVSELKAKIAELEKELFTAKEKFEDLQQILLDDFDRG